MTKYILNLEPKPQARPRFSKNGTYKKQDMIDWEQLFKLKLKKLHPSRIEKGAVFIGLTFLIKPPKYITDVKKNARLLEKELIYVDKKPDLDNYIKAVLDASNGVLFKDDGQIGGLSAQKFYSLNPRIELVVEKL